MKRFATSAVIILTAITLTACNSASKTQEAEEPLPKIGDTVSTDTIALKINSVTTSNELDLSTRYAEEDTAPYKYPKAGAEFVLVNTTITNNDTRPWDLTCSFDVDASLVYNGDKEVAPTDADHFLVGNPECNSELNPGLSDDMTWIFEVPEGAKLDQFSFIDADDAYDDSKEYTRISLEGAENQKTSDTASSTTPVPSS